MELPLYEMIASDGRRPQGAMADALMDCGATPRMVLVRKKLPGNKKIAMNIHRFGI